ncbi:hypothetical protein [Rhodohalobacter barkolensis]|uniref:Cytochrome oxidase subunit I profile domain-containing protein n=1 Tax=Rhodohalobacter barkolensis TaxID=2053187 RepID=A0A2N0VEU8_9BACT|nr:hypothetical protein [Rhodohalobacter barkolensis]PKD42722.1 hypothetical protein CWD77_15090 [Rhodohalobacter barkolensis]
MEQKDQLLQKVWLWSLSFFMLAALTGFLYRWGLIGGEIFGLRLTNVRHAHSHLMFFNWVTPVPMVFIARKLLKTSPEAYQSLKWSVTAIILIGFTSFPFFLLYGYHPVQLGSANLPLSVMLSGLVMIGWYWFMAIYIKHRKKLSDGLSTLFYDGALVMLFVSSLGAWGVAVAQFSNIDNNLISGALTHFFLTVFTEGWCVLAAIGIYYDLSDQNYSFPVDKNWLIAPIVLGAPLMFPFGLSVDLLNESLLWTAKSGSLLVGIGLGINLFYMARALPNRNKVIWSVVLTMLALKVTVQLSAVFLPETLWLGQHGLRVLYLHLLLLGFVSTLFFAAFHTVNTQISKAGIYLFLGSVFVLISTLVIISGLWPPAWQPTNVYQWVTVGAILPSIAIAVELVVAGYSKFKQG